MTPEYALFLNCWLATVLALVLEALVAPALPEFAALVAPVVAAMTTLIGTPVVSNLLLVLEDAAILLLWQWMTYIIN